MDRAELAVEVHKSLVRMVEEVVWQTLIRMVCMRQVNVGMVPRVDMVVCRMEVSLDAYQEVVVGSVGRVEEVVLGRSQDVACGSLWGNQPEVVDLPRLDVAPIPAVHGPFDAMQCGVTETMS
jgi:hypothetical protein